MNNSENMASKHNFAISIRAKASAACSSLLRAAKGIVKQPIFYCFCAPFLIMLGIYAAIGVFPFGNNSVLVLDLNGQYVYFFEALRDWVYGDGSLLYSFSRALGGEFMGIYAYYLASPLSYIVALFPKSMMTEALLLMILIKCGLCGLSFGWLLRIKTEINNVSIIAFSCLYALCGYVVVMQHNTMWIDNVFLLPCIIIGIDSLIRENRYKLFTFSLIWAIMSNYYIGYMTCIFVFLYFFYSFFSEPKEKRNPNGYRLHFLSSIFRIGAFSAIAIAIAAVIVLPAYYSLTFGKTTFSNPDYSFVSRFDLFDLATKLLFGAYDTVRPEGLPNIYCGIIVLFLLPFYFTDDTISKREKICNAIMCAVFVASFSINTLDMIWHGFQAPNWLNYRYSYMLVFFLVLMSAKGFQNIKTQSNKILFFTASVLVLFTVLADELEYKHINFLWTVLASLACIAVYFFVLNFIIRKKHLPDRITSLFLIVFVCLEMFLGGLANTLLLDADVVISNRPSYRDYMEKWEGAFEYVKEIDSAEFYRMEKTNYRRVNDSYTIGYRGLSGSSSTLNEDTVAFLDKMGYMSASHSSQYTGSTPVADMLLGVKYIASENKISLSQLYEKIYTDENVTMYKNPYALSVAYTVSSKINDVTFIGATEERPTDERESIISDSPFVRLNKLVAAMMGEEEAVLYKQLSHTVKKENSKESTSRTRITAIDTEKDAYVSFTVKGVGDKDIYAYFPTFYYTDADMYLNDEEYGRYFTNGSTGYIYVGRYAENEGATVKFKLKENGIYLHRHIQYFYYLDEEALTHVYDTLSAGEFKITECKEHYFYGNITVRDGFNTVLTTIPYDKGWKIVANGEKIDTYETLDALLAFDLPTGEYTLSMRYMPSEYVYGLCISLAGVIILLAILITDGTIKRKKQKIQAKDKE